MLNDVEQSLKFPMHINKTKLNSCIQGCLMMFNLFDLTQTKTLTGFLKGKTGTGIQSPVFCHWEMGFEALGLVCQWKTATGNTILTKLELEIGISKKHWAEKWDLYRSPAPSGSSVEKRIGYFPKT